MSPQNFLKSHAREAALLFAFTTVFCSVVASQTGEPPKAPILRIETGMHTAPIKNISVDRAGMFLVTASIDKTVRVWELATGRLLRVLRVPIGDSHEGALYTVASSPDGNTIATGGWTSESGFNGSIYLFDRDSGRLVRRLTGLPNLVYRLVFSPDGALFAAMFADTNGVRVWRTSDWAEVGRDTSYGDSSYGVDFDQAGRLVTSCFDGSLRLYEVGSNSKGRAGLRLIAKRKAVGGTRPADVVFSPDSSLIAVGFEDSISVAVLSGRDLTPLYAPDISGVHNGNFAGVAWSADGNLLYAGGYAAARNGHAFIRTWMNKGRGTYRDLLLDSTSTIFHILPLSAGGVVYGAGDPSFGVLSTDGRQVLFTSPGIADYRNIQQALQLSTDGEMLQFSYEPFGQSPARFSLTGRRLDDSATSALTSPAQLNPPVISVDDLNVTDWFDTEEPKLNNQKLELMPYEFSRTLAITPDASAFLLGTNFFVRFINRNGKERWQVPVQSEAYGVNISGDGRLALVAYGDGTIRWYRMTDGKELLTFFPHKDRKRWVLWTPSGYYDASPGGEDLIGWHVNNRRDQAADFFPVGQFRNIYYRPDVISKVLQTGDEQLALKQANEEAGRKQQQAEVAQLLPPVVEIVSPADGAEVTTTEIVVRYNVRTPSGEPVTEVRALIDGRPANAERGLSLKSTGTAATGEREMRVSVPEGESQVSVIASNRFTTSVPATVRVRARKTVASSPVNAVGNAAANATVGAAFEIKPKLYVLAVGVSNYADPKLKLGFPAKDASDFAAAMERQKGGLYRDVVVRLLTDERATKEEVLDGLDWIRKETTSKDVAMVLFAGHGINDQNGRYFYLPYNTDLEKLLRTGVSFEDIKNTVSALAGKTLFFIDTCHSGNVLGTRRALNFDIVGVVNELSSAENGAVVFAASTGNQYSLENVAWNNGAFTLAVVEGVGGRADYDKTGRGRITINMLDLYISERVKELTKGQQTPTTAKPSTVPDFPVALKK
jgi:WD40 repeat protein